MRRAIVVSGLVVVAVVIVGLVAVVGHVRLTPPGEELVYEDFGFSVVGTREVSAIGEGTARVEAQGVFRVVELKVANHNQAVSYRLDSHDPVLLDAMGNAYRAESSETRLHRTELAHGEECVVEYAYDVPRDAHDWTLHTSWGGPLFDLLYSVVYGNRRLLLPIPQVSCASRKPCPGLRMRVSVASSRRGSRDSRAEPARRCTRRRGSAYAAKYALPRHQDPARRAEFEVQPFAPAARRS